MSKLPNMSANRSYRSNRGKDRWNGPRITHHRGDGTIEVIMARGAEADADRLAKWKANCRSFTFRQINAAGERWLLTVRKERRRNSDYWYAFKSIDGKTHKVYSLLFSYSYHMISVHAAKWRMYHGKFPEKLIQLKLAKQ